MNNHDKSVVRLQSKVFWIIWTILTVMILSLAGLFIYQTHTREVRRAKEEWVEKVPDWQRPTMGEMIPPRFDETMRENQVSLVELLGIVILFELSGTLLAYALARYVTKPIAEVFAMQNQFVADASHELKTPLAVIISNSDLLEADLLEADLPDNQWLQNIQSEAVRMNEMVKQLLDLTVSGRDSDYQFIDSDLSEVVLSAVLAFESLAYEKGLKLKCDIDEGLRCSFDQLKIQQLVGILLDNAICHARPKSKIEVSLKPAKSKVLLKVRNQGIGITKGDEEKIFERFYRGDKAHNRQLNRYGLGLAIAKNIVQAHGGKIMAQSDHGWTEFVVTF